MHDILLRKVLENSKSRARVRERGEEHGVRAVCCVSRLFEARRSFRRPVEGEGHPTPRVLVPEPGQGARPGRLWEGGVTALMRGFETDTLNDPCRGGSGATAIHAVALRPEEERPMARGPNHSVSRIVRRASAAILALAATLVLSACGGRRPRVPPRPRTRFSSGTTGR